MDHDTPQEDFVGDILEEEPLDGTTRIYFQNLNGLNWDSQGGKWPYVCEVVHGLKIDIACFAELNTDTNNFEVRQKMEHICRKQLSHSRLVMAASKQQTSTLYKPGGTAILASDAITTQIKSHSRDRMGRWASMCLAGFHTKRIRVISAYQVCASSRPGSQTAASQQRSQIIEESSQRGSLHRPTPRQAFIQDLQSFILQVQNEGEEIILVGDFNDDITSPSSGMDQLATTCGLIDLFSVRTGSAIAPATYQRGPRRLDYALISPMLLTNVRSAGYDPFGYRIPSDHRGLYIDLNNTELFCHDHTTLAPAEKREFNSSNPGTVCKYVTAKMTYLRQHNFFARLNRLKNLTQPDSHLAESLDRDFQRASLHAAKECSSPRQAPWSPLLAEAWAELHYYRLSRSTHTTAANLSDAITKLREKWPHLPATVPTDLEVIKEGYSQALNKLKDARSRAKELREEYLNRKTALYNALEEKGKAKAVQRLIRAEMQHKVYNKIRYLRRHDQGSLGLSSLKIPRHVRITDSDEMKQLPDTPDHWETITIPQEIEQLLLVRNRHHFGQAEGTPFTIPPLNVDVGYKAEGFAVDLMLKGQIRYNDAHSATKLLIKHLQARTTTTLKGEITIEEVRSKLKRWKESTTTSPSGLHLGHYHCMWRDPQLPPTDGNRELIVQDQENLLSATVVLLNYALKFGYTYHRWSRVVNVMLQKDEGNPRIHRLRVIHIYEADYNMLLAMKWRQGMHHAEDTKILNEGLYGSRPGRSALDPALIEVLQHEIYRMSMKPGVNFDLDATSCYDRILTSLASICSRRIGIAKEVALLNASTLEKARYYLKTSLGVSESYYKHSTEYPIHGTGQGSGNSPSIWCFVCSALFDAFASKAHGATFTDYDRTHTIQLFMIGFVDDCAQRVNQFDLHHQPSTTTLLSLMQRDAQLWNDLLWAAGGALEHQKCSFHLIGSSWNDDGHPFVTGGTTGMHIHLSHEGSTTATKQMSNYKSHKTLGCYINPAHCHAQTWTIVEKKNIGFATLLETNFFSRAEAWVFYTSIYLPSLSYPLPITPLSKIQCQQLDSRFLRVLLPRCGYNRNMSNAIRHGPIKLGGAGFRRMYVEQGSLLLQQIFKHLNCPHTQIGRLLYITISWTQAFLGTSECFLTNVQTKLPPSSPSILLDLRSFLQDIDGKLILHPNVTPLRLRQNDRFIMDIALGQRQWSTRQLTQINACRRYLQAQTLADITNLSGTKVHMYAITGEGTPSAINQRNSTFNQRLPGKPAWRTWKKFLHTIGDTSGVLTTPLGPWTVEYQQLRQRPTHVYNPATDDLYTHVSGNEYKVHYRLRPGIFLHTTKDRKLQAKGYPSSVLRTSEFLRPSKNFIVSQSARQEPNQSTPTPVPSPEWERELLAQCRTLAPQAEILDHIHSGNILICSDGSVIQERGTFGFVVATSDGHRLAKCHGPAPGAFANSFRSEAYGVLATMLWLHQATQGTANNNQVTIIHYLDNKSVITRIERAVATTFTQPNHRLQAEQDVIDEICYIVHQLPITIKFKWIKGHQDSRTPVNMLPLNAQLNCEADYEASMYDPEHNYPWHQVPPLPHTPCQLVIQGKYITAKIKTRAQEAATAPALFAYLQNRFRWSDEIMTLIDWENFSHILQKYKEMRTTIIKHIHNISPTGKIAHRNNNHLPHECPACSQPYETNAHVIICPHRSRAQWREATIQKLQHHLSTTSDPYMIDILRDGLTRFHHELQELCPEQYPPRYARLIITQNAIGWDQLYKGRWSKEWQLAHHQFLQRTDQAQVRKTGQMWVLSVGRLLMDQWLAVWKIRNEERHGKDHIQQLQIRRQRATSELTELYTYKIQVCPCDRDIFMDSVDAHLAQHQSLESIENWISTYTNAIKASVTQAQALGIARNRTLLEYPMFNPIVQAGQQAG